MLLYDTEQEYHWDVTLGHTIKSYITRQNKGYFGMLQNRVRL